MSEHDINRRPEGAKPDVHWVDPSTEDHWLTRPATIRKLWWIFGIVLALTVLAQFFIPVKGKFPVESSFGFGAWYGFVSCVAMVLVAKALGWWLKKPKGYYSEPTAPAGPPPEKQPDQQQGRQPEQPSTQGSGKPAGSPSGQPSDQPAGPSAVTATKAGGANDV